MLSSRVQGPGYEDRHLLSSMFAAKSAPFTYPQGVGLPGSVWADRRPVYFSDIRNAPDILNGLGTLDGDIALASLVLSPLLRVAERAACDVRSTLVQPFGRGVLEVGTVRRCARLSAVSDAVIWGLVKRHADRHHAAAAARAQRAARAKAAADELARAEAAAAGNTADGGAPAGGAPAASGGDRPSPAAGGGAEPLRPPPLQPSCSDPNAGAGARCDDTSQPGATEASGMACDAAGGRGSEGAQAGGAPAVLDVPGAALGRAGGEAPCGALGALHLPAQ